MRGVGLVPIPNTSRNEMISFAGGEHPLAIDGSSLDRGRESPLTDGDGRLVAPSRWRS